MSKLEKYNFTDEIGHPLENCVDYQNILKQAEKAEQMEAAIKEYVDSPSFDALENLKSFIGK